MQYLVLKELLVTICMVAHWPWELQKTLPLHSEKAQELRADASRFRREHPSGKVARLADRLVKAADAYEELGAFASFRHRAVVVDIAKIMHESFGSPMYRSTATIASVALESEITLSKVREWFSPTTRRKVNRTMGKKTKKRSFSTESNSAT